MSPYDLSKCYIDFTLCPQGERLTSYFPELSAFDEFMAVEDDNLIRIAISTADIESPFLKIKERSSMLSTLFAYLRIPVVTEEERDLFNSVLEYKHVEVLNCYSRYLQILHDIDWTEYQSTKQTHDILTFEAYRPKEKDENIDQYVKRKVNIQAHLKKVGQDLKQLEAKIFPESRAAREVAMNEAKRISTYAEKYAESNTFV